MEGQRQAGVDDSAEGKVMLDRMPSPGLACPDPGHVFLEMLEMRAAGWKKGGCFLSFRSTSTECCRVKTSTVGKGSRVSLCRAVYAAEAYR